MYVFLKLAILFVFDFNVHVLIIIRTLGNYYLFSLQKRKVREMAGLNYLASTYECSHLLDSLKGKEVFDMVHHTAIVKEVREEMKQKKLAASDDVLRKVENGMDKNGVRRLDYLKEKRTWTWLAATLIFICGTVLSALEFRDELRDRYGLEILNTPWHCDGCTSKFSTTHALSYKVSGLIHSRHNKIRLVTMKVVTR